MCREIKNMKTHIRDHQNTCFIENIDKYKCFTNQKSYSTFSPFIIIKRCRFEEKKKMTLNIIVNLQWTKVEEQLMVTLVRRWRRKHGISIDGCRSYKRRLHNNGGSWRMWLDKWRQPLWINILVSMHSIGNLISIVSSDTPVGAKVVKEVILRGVLDVNEDC